MVTNVKNGIGKHSKCYVKKAKGAWSKVFCSMASGPFGFWESIIEEVSSERLHAFGDTCFSGINARDQTQQLGSTVASTYQEIL